MYTKCIQNVCITKCIPHFNKLLHTFYISNLYQMYTKCLFTRRNPHFDKLFVYKIHTKFCIRNVSHILTNFCIHFVYKI